MQCMKRPKEGRQVKTLGWSVRIPLGCAHTETNPVRAVSVHPLFAIIDPSLL